MRVLKTLTAAVGASAFQLTTPWRPACSRRGRSDWRAVCVGSRVTEAPCGVRLQQEHLFAPDRAHILRLSGSLNMGCKNLLERKKQFLYLCNIFLVIKTNFVNFFLVGGRYFRHSSQLDYATWTDFVKIAISQKLCKFSGKIEQPTIIQRCRT